jgi:hypothetical protein
MNYEKDMNLTICITSSTPYDISYDKNTINISYDDLLILTKSLYYLNKNSLNNSNLLLIFENLETSNLVMFKFLCSSDCNNGTNFINGEITLNVIDFLKKISERENTLIEFSDHSLGSLVQNWDKEKLGMNCPIIILDNTTFGSFEMTATKTNFLNSSHNKLITMGQLSDSDDISIKFNNMSGTKIYEIIKEEEYNIKVLSTGISLENTLNINEKIPVHSEFKINKSIIIISSTHWCNLDIIETPINLSILRSYTIELYGKSVGDELDLTISEYEDNPSLLKRAISESVKRLTSGETPIKKFKI